MSFINFESAKSIEDKREDLRKARNNVLKLAEEKFYQKKAKDDSAKRHGQDKWMLPSLEKRLKEEGINMGKKHKKKKKKKKKRKRSSDSSSSEESCEEAEWVEKHVGPKAAEGHSSPAPATRDDWMNMPIAVPTVGIEEARGGSPRKRDEDAKKAEQKNMLDRPGQSSRELNPYWKDGGTGLPGAGDGSGQLPSRAAAGIVGDRGADWLRRALQRVKEQAAEQGRSPHDVAAERWGSLEKLESMLAAAESRKAGATESSRSRVVRSDVAGGWDRERRAFKRPGESVAGGSGSRAHNSPNQRWKKTDVVSREAKKPEVVTRLSSGKSSSSSDSDREQANDEKPQEAQPLSDKELNELGAKLVKAEIMGNESLAAELKRKLEQGRAARSKPQGVVQEETVLLTRTDHSRGLVRPLQAPAMPEPSGGRRKKQKADTHEGGKRVRYFADDDKYSLQEMFEREKLTTVDEQNEMFSKMAAKGVGRTESDRDMDDMFEERARLKESEGRTQAKERSRAISEHKRSARALDNCSFCVDSKLMLKHLLISIGSKVYLSVPPHQSLTEGHCLLAPIQHVPCATQLDEDVWAEMQTFRKALTAMFKKLDQDVVFFETAMHLRHFPHMTLHCVPMPREIGELAPIYFKKAILECEMEWASNKKLVDLAGKDVRRAVPKGLPYFAVDFGLDSGFAHVIEDEQMFPKNFAQEIIGGMLDLDHSLWRKQRRENFDVQRKKVVQFAKWWKPFDFTHNKQDSTDSDSN